MFNIPQFNTIDNSNINKRPDSDDVLIQHDDVSYDEDFSSMTTASSQNQYTRSLHWTQNAALLCLPPSDPFLNKRHADVQTEDEFLSNLIDQKQDKNKSDDSTFLYRINEPKLKSPLRPRHHRLFRSNSDKDLKKKITTNRMTNSLNFKRVKANINIT